MTRMEALVGRLDGATLKLGEPPYAITKIDSKALGDVAQETPKP
jgi:hypothetical protein